MGSNQKLFKNEFKSGEQIVPLSDARRREIDADMKKGSPILKTHKRNLANLQIELKTSKDPAKTKQLLKAIGKIKPYKIKSGDLLKKHAVSSFK